MKRKIIPAIVTTRKALLNCLEKQIRIICIDEVFYRRDHPYICRMMTAAGYEPEEAPVKNGVIWAKGVDWEKYVLYDPAGVL